MRTASPFSKETGFSDCAEMAGMTTSDQIRLLNLVKNIIENQGEKRNLNPNPFGQSNGETGIKERNCQFLHVTLSCYTFNTFIII